MIKKTTFQFVKLLFAGFMIIMSQSCNTCQTKYVSFNINVSSSIIGNCINLGDSVIVSIKIPNLLLGDDQIEYDVTNEEYVFGVTIQKPILGELDNSVSPFRLYADGLKGADLEMMEGEILTGQNGVIYGIGTEKSSLTIRPKSKGDYREVKFKITPKQKDMFLIHFQSPFLWASDQIDNDCERVNNLEFNNVNKNDDSLI